MALKYCLFQSILSLLVIIQLCASKATQICNDDEFFGTDYPSPLVRTKLNRTSINYCNQITIYSLGSVETNFSKVVQRNSNATNFTKTMELNTNEILKTPNQSDTTNEIINSPVTKRFEDFNLQNFLVDFAMNHLRSNDGLNISRGCFGQWSKLRANLIESTHDSFLEYHNYWSRKGTAQNVNGRYDIFECQ